MYLTKYTEKSNTFYLQILQYQSTSQRSTVVRNTVVRPIKVSKNPHILSTHSSLIPKQIDLKFDSDDKDGGMTPNTKNGTNPPNMASAVKGKL